LDLLFLLSINTVAEREHHPRLSSHARAEGRILFSFFLHNRQARRLVAGNRSGRPLPIYEGGFFPNTRGK
jgi:hypothetical protein